MADPKPDGRPLYDLMADWRATALLINEIGGDEWEKAIKAEIRQAMDEMGVRVVLWYGERMQDVTAMMGEFTPGDDVPESGEE